MKHTPWSLIALIALLGACQPAATPDRPVTAEAPAEETTGESPDAATSPIGRDDLDARVREAWLQLGDAPHRCHSFDYFPHGGMYTMYCRLKNFGSLEEIESSLGFSAFLSGPHKDGFLDVTSTTSFGHYNPAFVSSLTRWALPALRDEEFRERTQGIYNRFVQPLARTYWVTYGKLAANPEFWQQEQDYLMSGIAAGGVDFHYERFFFFLNPYFVDNPDADFGFFSDRGFDGGIYDGNVVKTAVGFWLRRGIDQTAPLFADALTEVLSTYDPTFLARHPGR